MKTRTRLNLEGRNLCLYCLGPCGLVNRVPADRAAEDILLDLQEVAAHPSLTAKDRDDLEAWAKVTNGDGMVNGWMCGGCVAEGEELADDCR